MTLFAAKVFDVMNKPELTIPHSMAKRLEAEAMAMRTPEEIKALYYSNVRRTASRSRKCCNDR